MKQQFFQDSGIASGHDAASAAMFDPKLLAATVDALADFAKGGPALEFGIGTGRIALPLAARGVEVFGIDIAEEMLDELRKKPGAEAITAVRGDFSSHRVPGDFQLVFLVYNALTTLTTQEEQVVAMRNAAAHLHPGGYVVTETWIPALQRLPQGETFRVFAAEEHHLAVDEYDVVNQLCTSHHYLSAGAGLVRRSSHHRYLWPAELDLMARLSGLELRHRWSSWGREPLTADSDNCISTWQKPVTGPGHEDD